MLTSDMQCVVLTVFILMTMTLPPCLLYEIKEQYVQIGDMAIFRVYGGSDDRFTFRNDDDDEQLMVLSDTGTEDSNSYVCRSNTGERTPIVSYRLVVIEPVATRIHNGSFSGPTMEVNETGNVSMWCNVTGEPKPTISWYTYFNQETPTEIGIFGPKLEIRNISRECPWRYYCLMDFAKYQDMTAKKEINLTINYSPKVDLEISKRSSEDTDWHEIDFNGTENSFAANITDRIRLHCSVDTRPYNYSVWSLNGEPFITHHAESGVQAVNTHHLLYDIAEQAHAVKGQKHLLMVMLKFNSNQAYGLYECQAQNSLGKQSASFYIRKP
ncbi:protein amalgam-like [Ylistrum balloti]|uniref:protein amalgam-like n=1 Tax=Ylistrum balloti TaxID=509963 RepID=UPI00290593B8|nr:protein amalgam-like [Ylistrum balloti]